MMGVSNWSINLLLKTIFLTLLWLPSEQSSQVQSYKVSYSPHDVSENCPCSNPKWCEPITRTGKEVFAFSTTNDIAHWKLYDWSKVTTVVMFGYVNQTLMCLAHSHGVRVAILGSVSNTTFMNPDLRKKWIAKQMNISKQNFLDGINFDYESVIKENETNVRDAYTALVKETNEAFKKEMPHFQVTVDVAWKPNIDIRFYDYVGLAENSDFLFVMAYDEQSQIFGECLALPNSALSRAFGGLAVYLHKLRKEIPANKLVLGIPWYGYHYPCIKKEGEKCHIKEVPFRGANCSDAAGSQITYAAISGMLKTSKTKWNASSSTPYFDCTMSFGQPCQVHYDNAHSLSLKYLLAYNLGLRGVGMWNIDQLDYSDTPEAKQMRQEMFGILPGQIPSSPPTRSQKSLQKLLNFDVKEAR